MMLNSKTKQRHRNIYWIPQHHTKNCLIKKNSDRAGHLNEISSRVMWGGGGERGNSYESIFKISNPELTDATFL